MNPQRVIVIGDVMLDVVVRPLAEVATTSDTPSVVRMSRGGAAANLAVALARSHHDVFYVGVVGADLPGQMWTQELEREGVTPLVRVVEGSTGVVIAIVASDGQRSMMTDRGVNRSLSAAEVTDALAAPFDHLHVSGYTVLEAATREAGARALALARSRGVTTSIDVCSVGPLRHVTPGLFLDAAKDASTLFANKEEAVTLAGTTDVMGALDVLSRLFNEVVVTLGPNGAVARGHGETVRVAAPHVDVLDTTGAGDAATGAYLGARLGGRSIREALDVAMASASVVVQGLGSRG